MSDTQVFESNGLTITYAAEGAGPALVLVVDRGCDLGSLSALSHLVSSADFRVVRVDTDRADDLFVLLDHLGIADAWIGGHGTGGVIARAAAEGRHDRVNGLLLLGVDTAEAPPLPQGIPVLVVQSSDDEVTPPAHGEALRASAPGLVSVVTVEGGGHLFPQTRAGEAAWAIEDYLDWD